MRRFVANLVAAALFAHAIFGCCAHHVHAFEDAYGPIGLVAGCAGVDAHHCDSGEACARCCEERGQPDPCQEGKCDFGRPGNERTAKSYPSLFWLVALPLPSECLAAAGNALLEGQFSERGDQQRPARLHLLHQVLLI